MNLHEYPVLVQAIVQTISQQLSGVPRALQAQIDLEACGAEQTFSPRRDLFAQEGSAEKWLQRITGYYFADAILQDVRFAHAGGAGPGVRFQFYYDPAEPLNSQTPGLNVNPEVLCALFTE